MRHGQIRKVLADRIGEILQRDTLPVPLYDYQREFLKNVQVWLRKPRGTHRAFASQATGLGKTVEFSALVAACEGVLRVLVIVPNRNLVVQTVRKITEFTNGRIAHMATMSKVHSRNGDLISLRVANGNYGNLDVVVTTDESFKTHHAAIRDQLKPHLVVWDECHWAYTEKAQAALASFNESVIIAFSATPNFLSTAACADYVQVILDNGQVLYGPPDRFAHTHFGEQLDDRSVRWGIEHEHLCPFAWGRIEFRGSLKGVPTVMGPAGVDYDNAALHRVLAKRWPTMTKTICRLYQSGQYNLRNRSAVAICPGVVEAQNLAAALKRIGVPTACVTGSTPDEERDAIFAAFERGEIKLITSVFVLREGWDAPATEVCMMLRPTKSRVLYMQFMGRVLRLDPANSDKIALVLDPHFQDTEFAPLSAPVLFGTIDQEVRNGDIVINRRRRIPYSPYLQLDHLEPVLVVEKFKVEHWAGPDGTFLREGEIWGTIRALARILTLADGTITDNLTNCRSCLGRATNGPMATFYALSDVKVACDHLLSRENRANSAGVLSCDGEQWIIARRIRRKFGWSTHVINDLQSKGCRTIPARTAKGRRVILYAVSDIERLRADLVQKTPRVANGDLFFRERGKRWGTIHAWAVEFGRSEHVLGPRLKSKPARLAKTSKGHPRKFYVESVARKAFETLPVKRRCRDTRGE